MKIRGTEAGICQIQSVVLISSYILSAVARRSWRVRGFGESWRRRSRNQVESDIGLGSHVECSAVCKGFFGSVYLVSCHRGYLLLDKRLHKVSKESKEPISQEGT